MDGDYTVSKKRLRLTSKDQSLIDVVKECLELNDITPDIYLRSIRLSSLVYA